jgi:N-acetylglucosamine-6-sulfatase
MRTLLTTSFLLLSFLTSATAAPNIIVILTDDQEDTGSMAYLPKIQALARQGVTFKNSFVEFSLCAPSRSSLLTGEASHNDGITSNKPTKGGGWDTFKRDEANDLAVWLKAAGYKTALIGKYQNGYGAGKLPRLTSVAYWSNAANDWFGIGAPDKQHYVPPAWDLWYAFTKVRYFDYTINENGRLHDFGHGPADYSTDVLKDRAVQFVKDQAGSTTPFFMLIATKAPHGQGDEGKKEPAIPAPAYAQAFADVELPKTPAYDEEDVSDKAPLVAKAPRLSDALKDQIEKSYRAELQSLKSVDDLVGDLVDTLKTTGKLDNTVIFYTSDNGYVYGDHRLFGKNSVYEPSIKVPLVVTGPGIPKNETRNQLVNNLDVTATVEQLAGLKPGLVPDGRSLLPVLTDANAPWRSALLVEGGNDTSKPDKRYAAVRTPTQKYVRYGDGSEELYDLVADPYELDNKVKDPKYASDASTLRSLHDRLQNCVGDGCWVP